MNLTHLTSFIANCHTVCMDSKSTAQPETPQADISSPTTQQTLSHSNNNQIIVILLLILLHPVGLVTMWMLMKQWPTWLKVVISAPLTISVVGIIAGLLFVMFVPVQFV